MEVKAVIDISDLVKKFNAIPASVTLNLRRELKHAATQVQRLARKRLPEGAHRYGFYKHARPTYRLRDSTETYLAPGNELTSGVFLNDQMAPYGKYIHEGFKSWKPDRFLNLSLQMQETEIIQGLQEAINRGLMGLNITPGID
jgi:hypothetical protein